MTHTLLEPGMLFRQSTAITVEGFDYTILYRDPLPKDMHRTGPIMHDHSVLELHVILGGRGHLHTENSDYPLHVGDCVLIGKNTRHFLASDKKVPLERFELQITYNEQPKKHIGFHQYLEETEVRLWHSCHALIPLAGSTCKEIEEKGIAHKERLRAYLTLILTELMRLVGSGENRIHSHTTTNEPKAMWASDMVAIDNILTLNHSITAVELANQLFISKRQLYRILQKYKSETFKQRLIGFRIEVARNLLKNTKLTVTAIAMQVGYDNSASFCKVFKKKTGMSPGEYRSRMSLERLPIQAP